MLDWQNDSSKYMICKIFQEDVCNLLTAVIVIIFNVIVYSVFNLKSWVVHIYASVN